MKQELERLWHMADEQLEQHEGLSEEYESSSDSERSWYHDGWADAMKWLMDVLEEELGLDEADENPDEW